MFFPESLLKLSPRDQQVTWLDPIDLDVETSAAATTVEAAYFVPFDRILILQNAHLHAQPGAAILTSALTIATFYQTTGNPNFLTRNDTDVAAGLFANLTWTGSIVVAPGWGVLGRGSFGGAAAPNLVNLALHGMLIPVANIQRV
jgi:hypothetical protein